MSRTAQPAFATPLNVWSLNRSNRQRNHTVSAAIQMKNQKLQRRTSPKSFVMLSMSFASHGLTDAVHKHPMLRLRALWMCWLTRLPSPNGRPVGRARAVLGLVSHRFQIVSDRVVDGGLDDPLRMHQCLTDLDRARIGDERDERGVSRRDRRRQHVAEILAVMP